MQSKQCRRQAESNNSKQVYQRLGKAKVWETGKDEKTVQLKINKQLGNEWSDNDVSQGTGREWENSAGD